MKEATDNKPIEQTHSDAELTAVTADSCTTQPPLKPPHPTKTVQYESKIVVEEEGRRSTQNIQISSTYTRRSAENCCEGEQNKNGNVVMETWISSTEDDTLSDIDTTTFLHLNLLTELARSKCICRKRQSDVSKPSEGAGTSEGDGAGEEEGEDEKPMKKARYSWQVKNLPPERTKENQPKSIHLPHCENQETFDEEAIPSKQENDVETQEEPHKTRKRPRNVTPESPDDLAPVCVKSLCQENPQCGATSADITIDHSKTKNTDNSESKEQTGEEDSSRVTTSSTHNCDSTSEGTNITDQNKCEEGTSKGDLVKTEKTFAGGDDGSVEPSTSQGDHKDQNESNPVSSAQPNTTTSSDSVEEGPRPLQLMRNRSRERPSRSYLQKLQHQHIAKSIVDNALNTTLEVLGFSPDNSRRNLASQRRRVEDDAVSAAIQSRGLHNHERATSNPSSSSSPPPRPSSSSSPPPSSSSSTHTPANPPPPAPPPPPERDIDPIISQLTEFSENIFARNLQRSGRTRALSSGTDETDDSSEEGESNGTTPGSSEASTPKSSSNKGRIPSGRRSPSDPGHSLAIEDHEQPSVCDNSEGTGEVKNSSPSAQNLTLPIWSGSSESSNKDTSSAIGGNIEKENPSSHFSGDVFNFGSYLDDSAVLQSDILDKAVAAAINQKGLGLDHVNDNL